MTSSLRTKHNSDSIHYKPGLGTKFENGQSIVDLSQHFGRETARFGRMFISLAWISQQNAAQT